jgi:hypothetical protein
MIKRLVLASAAAAQAVVGVAAAEDDPRLGEKVDRICFASNINNFSTIKGVDDAALLEANVDDWYRVDLIGACSYQQLRFAQSVAIDERPRGGCVTKGDALIFSNSAFGDFSFPNATRCVISAIYRWDEDAEEPESDE